MSEISRSLIYARPERGPDWFNDFLLSFAEQKDSTQDILNAIHNGHQTVSSVVQGYREQVGLDIIESADDCEDSAIKNANVKHKPLSVREIRLTSSFVPLSIRHAQEESSVSKIKAQPDLVAALESLCRHTGGTIKFPSLINFLRKRMGNDIKFNDDELKEYLTEIKNRYLDAQVSHQSQDYVGLVGVTNEDYDDDVAEYTRNGR